MSEIKLIRLPDVPKVNNHLGRCYVVRDRHYPSVSSILSETMPVSQKMALRNWRKGLGGDASKVQEDVKERGKNFHRLIECFALGRGKEVLRLCDRPEMKDYVNHALPILKHLTTGEVIFTEAQVYSYQYEYAGTLDMLAWFPDPSRIVLLDWKTSNKPKKIEYCDHHFLQLAAYSNALKETYNCQIHQATVCIFYSFQKPTIFTINPDELTTWFEKFLERLKQYRIKKNPLGQEAFDEYYANRFRPNNSAPGA